MSVYLDTEFVGGVPSLLSAPIDLVDECMPYILDANARPHAAAACYDRVYEICRDALEAFDGQEAHVAAGVLMAFGEWLARPRSDS